MKIAISATSGLIGSYLKKCFSEQGHEVIPIVRKKGLPGIYMDVKGGEIDRASLEDLDACIHLMGENIAKKRWSSKQKEAILKSRVDSTKLLAETLNSLDHPPKVFVCASADGIYGTQTHDLLTESSALGHDFLAHVCTEWEKAAHLCTACRVVNTRFAMVLSSHGGILQKLVPIFRLGLGAIFSTGDNYLSWITLQDLFEMMHHVLISSDLKGAVNFSTPNPVTQKEFCLALGQLAKRPVLFSIPKIILQLFLGEFSEATLLSSRQVYPQKLLASHAEFKHPVLEEALKACLPYLDK